MGFYGIHLCFFPWPAWPGAIAELQGVLRRVRRRLGVSAQHLPPVRGLQMLGEVNNGGQDMPMILTSCLMSKRLYCTKLYCSFKKQSNMIFQSLRMPNASKSIDVAGLEWNISAFSIYIGNVIIPIDELIFFTGVQTINQN